MAQNLHVVTPLLKSMPLSNLIGQTVYIKLDNSQPTSSFKIRGIGRLVRKFAEDGAVHVVSSSGGNAGVAVAYAARKLGISATVFLPATNDTTMAQRVRAEGADAVTHGKAWDDANQEAIKFAAAQEGRTFVHPFDHPAIWDGNSTVIDEIFEQLAGLKPSAVVVSVGGGGLLAGVCQGLKKCGWDDVPIVAMETEGANCFNASLQAEKVVTLDEITSIAATLGAKTPCQRAFELAFNNEHPILSWVVSDKEAVSAMLHFADDHRFLVEPACGATLASLYGGVIDKLIASCKIGVDGPIVAVICGGGHVTIDMLRAWKEKFGIN